MIEYAQWEYKRIWLDTGNGHADRLNFLGSVGWELVAIVKDNFAHFSCLHVFKRPRLPESENAKES